VPVIEVDNVSKRFYLRYTRELVATGLIRSLLRRRRWEEFWALRNVSFKVERGESVGIIGPNGSGKTTLLSIISGVTRPTEGRVSTTGRISALLQLGAGFHPDLTGRENVYINAGVLGFRKHEINRIYPSIAEFSELGNFLDAPVRRYSSGMLGRLGFSIAIHVRPEIIIVDEVLSVGDQHFQKKCREKILEFLKAGVTVLFVSHSAGTVRELCQKALYLDQGNVQAFGDASEVLAQYAARANRGPTIGTGAQAGPAARPKPAAPLSPPTIVSTPSTEPQKAATPAAVAAAAKPAPPPQPTQASPKPTPVPSTAKPAGAVTAAATAVKEQAPPAPAKHAHAATAAKADPPAATAIKEKSAAAPAKPAPPPRTPEAGRKPAPTRPIAKEPPSRLRPIPNAPFGRLGRSATGMSNATYFYRNGPQVAALFDHVFPLIKQSKQDPVVRVRCWGCSIGSEPYTLAMEYHHRGITDYKLVIEAFDSDPELVQAAIGGEYNESEIFYNGLSFISPEKVDTYFDRNEQGNYVLKEVIRKKVLFGIGDFLQPECTALHPVDIAMAQNRLMHCQPETARRAVAHLVAQTRPGGILCLGGTNLDVLVESAHTHGLEPITYRLEEIHDGWRCRRRRPDAPWGLGPLDRTQPDWEIRYCSLFRKADNPG